MLPVLSIITPIYNGERFIDRYSHSLLRIDPKNRYKVEIILIDDGSTDNSLNRIRQYESEQEGFNSITVIHQENGGSAAAKNTGLNQAVGKWILFLDVDDELANDPMDSVMDAQQETCLLYPVEIIKNGLKHKRFNPPNIKQSKLYDLFTAQNPLTQSSIIFKKETLIKYFDINKRYLEDWLFWLKNLRIFDHYKIIHNHTIALIHAHDENKSSQYRQIGVYRSMIAKEILDTKNISLTAKQKHNLIIQYRIGRILSHNEKSYRDFFRYPCNTSLWFKLLIYSFFYKSFKQFDYYQSHETEL
ncbi:glycosyltransferase family 2 protein [Poriferisphaera sp. WC338]|uniref:glycosyltransferase family 2 protein n=1 Tax=Poriferisphaera sp. WC338 TaxID=3425129 RepID=UPI003D81C00B